MLKTLLNYVNLWKMAKRFISTELFDDEYFCSLSKDGKLFFVYFITKCDHAGILKLNTKLCEFQTGIKNIETVIKELDKCLLRVKNDNTFFMPKFIKFQYPDFPKSKVKQQDSALKILISYGLYISETNSYLTVNKELDNSYGNEHGNGNEDEVKDEKPKKEIPHFNEFLNHCKTFQGYHAGYDFPLKAKYESWVADGWKDGNGNEIKNWKTKIANTFTHLKPMQGTERTGVSMSFSNQASKNLKQ